MALAGTRTGTGTDDDPYLYGLTATATVDTGPARAVTINGTAAETGGAPVTLLQSAAAPFSGTVVVADTASGTQQSFPVTQAADGTVQPGQLQLAVVEPDPTYVKSVDGLTAIGGTPFLVLDGVQCTPAGLGDAVATARRRLELSEQRSVEHAFWDGDINGRALGAGPILADPDFPADHIVAGSAGAPVPLVAGVAALELQMGVSYPGTAVLHASRDVAVYAARDELVVQQPGGPLRTPLGSAWAFGGGYPGTGPDHTARKPDEAWLFATGAVVVRRGPVTAHEAFDGRHNVQTAIAERPVVVTVECETWAAYVKLEAE